MKVRGVTNSAMVVTCCGAVPRVTENLMTPRALALSLEKPTKVVFEVTKWCRVRPHRFQIVVIHNIGGRTIVYQNSVDVVITHQC